MSSSNGNGGDRRDGSRRGGLPLQAASRVTGLVSSVMDLHVRIALQEADREKRRLIGGALLLVGGLVTLLLSLIAAELALLLWFRQQPITTGRNSWQILALYPLTMLIKASYYNNSVHNYLITRLF